MARKTAKAKHKQKKETRQDFARGDGVNSSAQDSEYRDLRKRVDARKDAKQILKIARRIQEECDN